jgi:hypothetical protein
MASQTFRNDYDGYWREVNSRGLPSSSGVYTVYECTFNKGKDTVSIHKKIYIGEAGNIKERIENHEKKEDWLEHVRKGNTLCYNAAHVDATYRERVEAALIFEHEPPENEEYTDSFPFDTTTIKTMGNNKYLKDQFIIQSV